MNVSIHLPAALRRRFTARPRGARWTAILAAAVLAACGDGGGTGPKVAPVAAVTLAGAPEGPVVVGSTVPLTATPVDAAGAALSDRAVTWESSDTSVARVGSTGAVAVRGVGNVTITARAEGKAASATLDARDGGQLNPGGGTLNVLGGRVRLTVQPGGVFQPVTFLFRPAVSPPTDPRQVPGTAVEMAPADFPFSPPGALLTLAYDPVRVPAGLHETSLRLYRLESGVWEVVRGSRADLATHTVTGVIARGGTFAVAASPVETVVLGGRVAGGAVYVGQTRPLVAAALDAFGDTLRGRTFVWSTSDPARATVDGAGNVRGQAPGTVTITAEADGVQGSTSVTVLPRPVARWGQTEEWATLQGNARHTGWVDATLDPAVFRVRWSKTLGDGAGPRMLATGAGNVFVSTGPYGAAQRLTAFDAATGAESWSRTFTSVDLLSAPAFADGRVYALAGGGTQGALWALDADDGAVRFASPYDHRHGYGPNPVVGAGGVYVGGNGTGGGGVHRFDAASGAWSYNVPLSWMDGQTPAVADGKVYAYGTGDAFGDGLTVLDAVTGAVDRTVAVATQSGVRTPVLGDRGNLVVANGAHLASVSLASGAIEWARPGSFTFLPAVGGGVVYGLRPGAVVAARESDGALRWTWSPPAGGDPWGSIVVTENLLFVSVQQIFFGGATWFSTHAIDIASGKEVWDYPSGGFLALSSQGTLFIASPTGTLAAVAVR